MKVAVTGANGFVGRATCERLTLAHHQVRPLIRTPDPGWPAALAVGDVHGKTDWSQALQGIDCVVHCAARVHVMAERSSDPLAAFRTVNVEGTQRLAQEAVQAGVRRLVFLSSLKVLGEASPPGHPLQARSTPQPTDPYGLTKWEAENALRAIGNASGLEVVVIRPPLVYGPGVKANFARLVQAVARGIPLPLGSVHNKRSLVGMDNLTDLIQCCVQLPSAAHQTFLVSDGVDTSTPELIQAIAQAMGRPARLWRVPVGLLRLAGRLSGQGAQVERLTGSLQVDIRHTREVLGWTPQVTLQQGLQSVVQDYLK